MRRGLSRRTGPTQMSSFPNSSSASISGALPSNSPNASSASLLAPSSNRSNRMSIIRSVIGFTIIALFAGVIISPPKLSQLSLRTSKIPTETMSEKQQLSSDTAVSAANAFGISTFVKISKPDSLISPPSIAAALSLAAIGATENSTAEAEFTKLFPIPITLPSAPKDKSIELRAAASAWLTESVKESFRKESEASGASIHPVPKNVDVVNKWVADVTKGRITTLLNTLPNDLVALLLTAVYLRAPWEKAFDPKLTREVPFFVSKDKQIQAKMMRMRNEKFPYATLEVGDGEISIVELPYGKEGELAATFIVPDGDKTDIGNVVDILGKGGVTIWNKWMNELSVEKVNTLGVPKFKLEFGPTSLKDELLELGLRAPFVTNLNDPSFLGITDDPSVVISDVIHKATVEVTEEGTVASAATVVILKRSLSYPNRVVIMDRPFLFAIRNKLTGAILFIGRVDNPICPE